MADTTALEPEAVLAAPVSGVSPEALANWERSREVQVQVLAGQANRLVAQTVELAHEALRDKVCLASDLPLARWLAWSFGSDPAWANKIAAIAERYEELPTLIGALDDGSISLDQAAVIAYPVPASHEAEAVHCAESMRPCQLRRWATLCPPLHDEDEDEDEDRDDEKPRRERESFSLRPASDSADADWLVSGRLGPELGGAFDNQLRQELDALWAARRRGELDDDPTVLDALRKLLESASDSHAAVRPHSARAKVLIHVDMETGLGTFHLGPAIPRAALLYMSCDATYQVLFERHGVPVGIGRTSSAIPTRTRLAVEHRDQGCRVPGCGRQAGLHLHHVKHWINGGPTETFNLIALCPQHHRAHHNAKLNIDGDNADDPDGIAFATPGEGRRPNRPAPAGPDELPDLPAGNPYGRPEWGHISNWAMVPPQTGLDGSPYSDDTAPNPAATPAIAHAPTNGANKSGSSDFRGGWVDRALRDPGQPRRPALPLSTSAR